MLCRWRRQGCHCWVRLCCQSTSSAGRKKLRDVRFLLLLIYILMFLISTNEIISFVIFKLLMKVIVLASSQHGWSWYCPMMGLFLFFSDEHTVRLQYVLKVLTLGVCSEFFRVPTLVAFCRQLVHKLRLFPTAHVCGISFFFLQATNQWIFHTSGWEASVFQKKKKAN